MMNNTIKKEFYKLVLKIVIYTLILTIITYLCLFLNITHDNKKNMSADYYSKYLSKIAKIIDKNGTSILDGNLLDVKKYSDEIQSEVIDLKGNHIYGEVGVKSDKFDILRCINQDKYYNNYIYRYEGIVKDNCIKAVYVIKAPFGYIKNNSKKNKSSIFITSVVMVFPIVYFIFFLFLFTSKLYKNMYKDVEILLYGAKKITSGDFNFHIKGTKYKEFRKIEESFNTTVMVFKDDIEKLSKLDKDRRMMVSSVGHDIRTPITVIKGQLEIIDDLKENFDYDINTNMNIINKNCDKMIALTDNLSLIYKVEDGCFLFRNEKVNLKKLLKDKKLELITLTKDKYLEIEFNINLIKDYYILDSNMLFRVIDNIIYNSLRFTKRGKIILDVYDDNFNLGFIYFKCMDTGCGFKSSDTSKLFKAFYQDDDYKNHFGLGLYISKKIIENYKGNIKAYNNEFNGATIEFFIKELKGYKNI